MYYLCRGVPRKKRKIKDSKNNPKNITKRAFAKPTDITATPVNPSRPATMANAKKENIINSIDAPN